MNESITTIPFSSLILVLIPVGLVIGVLHAWSLEWKNTIYAIIRMLAQLLMIGYFLTYIFESDDRRYQHYSGSFVCYGFCR